MPAKRATQKQPSAFASFLKWTGTALFAACLWVLILTESIGENNFPAIIAASFISAIIALRLLYLLNLARISRSGSNALVDELDGIEFEHFCADVLKRNGFSKVRVTKSTGDFGADITALDYGGRIWVFQCKRYSSNIGNTPIQEVSAARLHYNAQCAAVLTNQHFTPAARQLAEENDVLLIEREKLFKLNRKPSKSNCKRLCKNISPANAPKSKDKISGLIIVDDNFDD